MSWPFRRSGFMTRVTALTKSGPLRFVRPKLPASGRREPVDAGPPVLLGCLPPGGDPALQLEALQGGIQRAELDRDRRPRTWSRMAPRDGVAVKGAEHERPEDEHVERAVEGVHMKNTFI